MRTLWLKPLRDVRRIKLRAATLTLMVAMGVGTYAGLAMSRESLFHTRDTIYDDLRLADLRVFTTDADPSELPSLDGIPGVARTAKRLVVPGSIEKKDGRLLNSLVIYTDPDPSPGVNDLRILKGGTLSREKDHGVVIERTLSEYHGYEVGEKLTLNPATFPTEVEIVGTGMTPECLIATADSTIFFPLKGSLGIVYAPMGLVKRVFGTPLYNEFSFLYGAGADRAAVERRILERLEPLTVRAAIRREDEFAYKFLDEALKGFSSFIPSIALVFGLVIFLVTWITSNRLVISQRLEIGVLRALGYRRRELLFSYALLASGLCLTGGALGAVFAYAFNVLFAGQYAFALGLPEVLPVMVPRYLVEGWVMAAAVVLPAFTFPLLGLLRLEPQRIIRPERRRAFLGIPAVAGKIGRMASTVLKPRVATRFAFRNLFRRLGTTVATTLTVSLLVALAGSFVVVLDSLKGYQDRMMEKEKWDLIVNLRYPLSPEQVGKIVRTRGIERAGASVAGFGQVEVDGATVNYQLVGFPANGWMRSLNVVQGRMFSADDEKGIVLNENWIDREKVKLAAGKEVTVRAGSREERLKIVGLVSEMTLGQAYLPIATAEALLGLEGKVNGLMASLSGPVESVKDALYRYEEVGEVFAKADIQKGLEEYLSHLEGILYATVGVSIAIGALFLFGSVLIHILEREIEYATLRAIGYDRVRIARIVLTELMAEAVAAVVASIPLAVLLAYFVNYQQGKIYFQIPTVVHGMSLACVGLAALLFIPLAGLPGLSHVFRLKIGDVVRERGMG